ncbi:MAG: hypothetical protein PHD53_00865 [Methylococcales bacterium]|nr:hypothetical protein [Methylococcales bacterium]
MKTYEYLARLVLIEAAMKLNLKVVMQYDHETEGDASRNYCALDTLKNGLIFEIEEFQFRNPLDVIGATA